MEKASITNKTILSMRDYGWTAIMKLKNKGNQVIDKLMGWNDHFFSESSLFLKILDCMSWSFYYRTEVRKFHWVRSFSCFSSIFSAQGRLWQGIQGEQITFLNIFIFLIMLWKVKTWFSELFKMIQTLLG